LQTGLQRCYDTGPDARRVIYDVARLVPLLAPQQTDWVQRVLQEAAQP
jgi:hypothetical protein